MWAGCQDGVPDAALFSHYPSKGAHVVVKKSSHARVLHSRF